MIILNFHRPLTEYETRTSLGTYVLRLVVYESHNSIVIFIYLNQAQHMSQLVTHHQPQVVAHSTRCRSVPTGFLYLSLRLCCSAVLASR